ncbi:MAG: hypothetical protein IPN79_13485 [Saprospiraceae bacterium]|nr:hypothetical protein [Saprospiraceae bacterium]
MIDIMDFFSGVSGDESVLSNRFFEFPHKDTNSTSEINNFDLIFMSANIPFANHVRSSLQLLSNHFPNIKSLDCGRTLNNDYRFMYQPLQYCAEKQKLAFLLGGNIDLAHTLSSQQKQKVTFVSNTLPPSDQISEQHTFLSFQRHLCEYKSLKYTDEFCPDSLSLGQMKSYPHLIEPILRDTEILYIHLNALRSAEIPGLTSAWPSGLNTEEMCQIAKYAGHSLQLKAVIIDCGEIGEQAYDQASKLVAELYWYLLEGFKMKQSDHPGLNDNISEYVVNMAEFDTELVFVKSNVTQRWWLKLEENHSNPFLSCAQEEYQQSIRSEVPERLLRHIL